MSRPGNDCAPDYDNADHLWYANLERAMKGKRGQKALRELRAALHALPKKALIEGALCTMNRSDMWRPVVAEKGEGVCALGAYVWWKNVRSGMSPDEAFASIPTMVDLFHTITDTADYAQSFGMTFTLAWEIADRNDGAYDDSTPEERYERILRWLDAVIVDEVAA